VAVDLEASRGVGVLFRERDGRFGSPVEHDRFDDESGP